jgi:hypothetical protein
MANTLDFLLRIFYTWSYIKGIFFVQNILNLSLNEHFVCMYTWIQTFCSTQRKNGTTQLAKSRKRILKDIYVNEYMTFASVSVIYALTIEQKYLVSYNSNALLYDN